MCLNSGRKRAKSVTPGVYFQGEEYQTSQHDEAKPVHRLSVYNQTVFCKVV